MKAFMKRLYWKCDKTKTKKFCRNPSVWGKRSCLAFSMHDGSLEKLLIRDHHLIKKKQILCLTKLNGNELYKIQIIFEYKKPMSQSYFGKNL